MATTTEVRQYLATWFQLGKGIQLSQPSGLTVLRPISVLGRGNNYSAEFETCWQQISADANQCYLEGTCETVAVLLTGSWAIESCGRCQLPIAMQIRGSRPADSCPCADVMELPNLETVPPRPNLAQFGIRNSLKALHHRLNASIEPQEQVGFSHHPPLLTRDPDPDSFLLHGQKSLFRSHHLCCFLG